MGSKVPRLERTHQHTRNHCKVPSHSQVMLVLMNQANHGSLVTQSMHTAISLRNAAIMGKLHRQCSGDVATLLLPVVQLLSCRGAPHQWHAVWGGATGARQTGLCLW